MFPSTSLFWMRCRCSLYDRLLCLQTAIRHHHNFYLPLKDNIFHRLTFQQRLCSGQPQTFSSVGGYVYTSSEVESALTPEQKAFYEENGFLVVRNLVPKPKLAVYR